MKLQLKNFLGWTPKGLMHCNVYSLELILITNQQMRWINNLDFKIILKKKDYQ